MERLWASQSTPLKRLLKNRLCSTWMTTHQQWRLPAPLWKKQVSRKWRRQKTTLLSRRWLCRQKTTLTQPSTKQATKRADSVIAPENRFDYLFQRFTKQMLSVIISFHPYLYFNMIFMKELLLAFFCRFSKPDNNFWTTSGCATFWWFLLQNVYPKTQ